MAHVAVTTTLLDCLSSGWEHLQHRCLKTILLPQKKKRTRKTLKNIQPVCITEQCPCVPPITTLFILLQPILDGRKRQNATTVGQQKLTSSGVVSGKCSLSVTSSCHANVRLFRCQHIVIRGVNFLKSYVMETTHIFQNCPPLTPCVQFPTRAATKNGGTKPGLHRLPGSSHLQSSRRSNG